MKLASSNLLRRVLNVLAAIADSATGVAAAQVQHRVIIEWHGVKGVRLVATDGARACAVMLAPDPSMTAAQLTANESACFILKPSACEALRGAHTVFKGSDGSVRFLGTRFTPGIGALGPSEFGVDMGSCEAWDVTIIDNFARAAYAGNAPAVSALEVNPSFLSEGVGIIEGLWDAAAPDEEKLRMHIHMPTQTMPMVLTSRGPVTATPLFIAEVVIAPYVSP